jgi:RimJ/RimL family protein N-acetyltransferase
LRLRRAEVADVDFLTELYADEDVRPYLAAAGSYGAEGILERITEAEREPDAGGIVVIEVDGDRAGAMAWERVNRRSRIASLSGVAVHPGFRGRRLADEAARALQRELILERGFHRLQLEIYGFNERAQRHAERSGFVREGVKRKAYRHGDSWVDGILYAIVAEDLAERGEQVPGTFDSA